MVERFLKGWFATIAYMRQNREKTVDISAKVFNRSRAVMDKAYDFEIKTMNSDGVFDPAGLEMLKNSFVELDILPTKPTDDQILTTKFVPVKP